MESSHKYRGKLTIYLGYSPGVGKTYEMLSNAINLYKEGVDIKIGYIEPHQRPETSSRNCDIKPKIWESPLSFY